MPKKHLDALDKVRRKMTKSELEKLVKELVRIESHRDVPTREREVAEHINEWLVGKGVRSKLKFVEKNRPNVLASVVGSRGGKSLMLSGHTDTVPAYKMDMPPFSPKVVSGKLYGRGSLDMKGGLGAMMMALVAIERSRVKLNGDLVFAAVVGEEDRSEGTEDVVLHGPRADMGIVGEPTDMEIQPTHRGLEWLTLHFYGKAAHGGQPDKGVNAISKAAKFIRAVESDLAPRLRERKSKYMLGPAINLGVIEGGQQPSSVADHCTIRADRRWTPEEGLDTVFKEIYRLFDSISKDDPDFKAKLVRDPANFKTMTHVPNVVPLTHPVVRALQTSVGKITGRSPKTGSFWGWTDAALLTHFAKIPTVVFGPGGAGAHARNEHVLTDDLFRCALVYADSALSICGTE